MRSTGKTDWENYVHIICSNINHCRMDVLGGLAPSSVDELTEYKVRLAQEKAKTPFLDWVQQEQNIKDYAAKKSSQKKIKLGDFVLLQYKKEPLDKSYDVQSGRMYIVRRVLASKDPVRFELSTLKGANVEGQYYEAELTVSPLPEFWHIREEENRKERTVNGRREVYVHYLYYPANEGEWILKKDLVPVSKVNEPNSN